MPKNSVGVLEEIGLSRAQAETHLKIISDVLGDEVATRADIFNIEQNMATKKDLLKLEHKVDQIEHKITLKLGALMTFLLVVLPLLTKYF